VELNEPAQLQRDARTLADLRRALAIVQDASIEHAGLQNARIVMLERERDALRAMNLRLRDKLLEYAKKCERCRGTGSVMDQVRTVKFSNTLTGLPPGVLAGRWRPCPDCQDLREVLQ
jgi:hypothetical protein